MQKIGCLAASIVLIMVLLIGAAVGSAAYGYSQLKTDFKAQEYSPVVDTGIGSIAGAIINIFKGDLLGAAASIIKGVNIDGTLTIDNPSFVPLYLPSMKHKVSVEGKESQTIVTTDAMWIAPNSQKHLPFRVTIASGDLPQVAINALAKGGTIDATIVSEFSLGTFSVTRTSHRQESITKSLSSYTGQQGTPPSIVSPPQAPEIPSLNFAGWYISNNKVSNAERADRVTGRISLSGGSAGSYKLRVRRDIRLTDDITVDELAFEYNGISTEKEISFIPPVATDESNTDGYHLDLLRGNNVVWTMADAYPPRLRVTQPTSKYALSVIINPSGAGTVSINPPGGVYDSGTVVTLTANPASGFQFASWSGDISGTSPTVTVTMNSNKNIIANFTTGQLSVSFVGWYVGGNKVNTATKGSNVIARITVSGGSPGQYKMRVRRDIVWADDQTVNELTLNHEGGLSTKDLAFIATYATGEASTDGYHIDLVKDGYVVWTLTDAYPPRLRVNP